MRKRRADYVLAVKGNQGNPETDIRQYFEDRQIREELKKGAGYKKTTEKAHGQIEIRGTKMSLRRKRFNISFAPAQFIEKLMKL